MGTEGSEDGDRILAGVDTDGTDRVVHFRSENATQIEPSPDGKWVAYHPRERPPLWWERPLTSRR